MKMDNKEQNIIVDALSSFQRKQRRSLFVTIAGIIIISALIGAGITFYLNEFDKEAKVDNLIVEGSRLLYEGLDVGKRESQETAKEKLLEAVKAFEGSIRLDDKNAKAYEYLIRTKFQLGFLEGENIDKQISIWEKALEHTTDGLKIAKDKGDKSSIYDSIQRMRARLLNNLAYNYAIQGENLPLAEKYIDEALSAANDSNPNYMDTKAWVMVRKAEQSVDLSLIEKQKIYDTAEQLISRSLPLLPDGNKKSKSEFWFHLGHIEKLRGRADKALEAFRKAYEFNPENEQAKKELN
jgi:tetratricopeptide (TPR) repeat protein